MKSMVANLTISLRISKRTTLASFKGQARAKL
jgi:hypothetical protein